MVGRQSRAPAKVTPARGHPRHKCRGSPRRVCHGVPTARARRYRRLRPRQTPPKGGALRAASAATHWQPRVWSGPRMGPKPGTTHHADVPQRLLSEPLPITDRARGARRYHREIYDSKSLPGGHDQSGLPVCTGYACVASVTLAVQSGLCRFSHPVRHAPPPRWCARSKKS